MKWENLPDFIERRIYLSEKELDIEDYYDMVDFYDTFNRRD